MIILTVNTMQDQISDSGDEGIRVISYFSTVKPLIKNTSEEFIKCRLDNFSMSFILYFVNFSICESKLIAMNMREHF